MADATFACPDLTTFAGLDELGREVVGQRLEPDRAVLACRVVEPDQWCRRCGCEGGLRWAPRGRELMRAVIDSVSHGEPSALTELITLGRTLTKRAADVLAYFDRPGTSNGPTEAISGRLEHRRGSAPGFRNLTTSARSPLETGGSRPHDTPECEEPPILPQATDGTGTPRVVQPEIRTSNWTIQSKIGGVEA